MAQSHQIQLEQLERALKDERSGIVRDALQAQIDTIKRKLNAKGNRKATLSDGTVGVGDKVYTISEVRYGKTEYPFKRRTITPGQIKEHTVKAINPKGDELSVSEPYHYSGRHSMNSVRSYYATKEGARAEMIERAIMSVARAKEELEQQRIAVQNEEYRLELTKLDDMGAQAAKDLERSHQEKVS